MIGWEWRTGIVRSEEGAVFRLLVENWGLREAGE